MVFSMDCFIAKLDKICDLADKYQIIGHFDYWHETSLVGKDDHGTHEC